MEIADPQLRVISPVGHFIVGAPGAARVSVSDRDRDRGCIISERLVGTSLRGLRAGTTAEAHALFSTGFVESATVKAPFGVVCPVHAAGYFSACGSALRVVIRIERGPIDDVILIARVLLSFEIFTALGGSGYRSREANGIRSQSAGFLVVKVAADTFFEGKGPASCVVDALVVAVVDTRSTADHGLRAISSKP